MRQIEDDLWETEPEHPMPGLSTHAYLWLAPSGNVLFYNTTHEHELDRIAELGGLSRQYLSHQDEIAPSLPTIKTRFGSRLHSSAAEADAVRETAPVDDAFDTRQVDPDGLEVLPTPGHTPGSTCFVVHSLSGLTYLFTGDSIVVDDQGRWAASYIEGMSDRATLTQSLTELAKLTTPDVVISSAFPGETGVTHLGHRSWADCVDEALQAMSGNPTLS